MSIEDGSIFNPRPPDKGSAAKGFLYGIAVNVGIFILCLPWPFVLVYSLGVIPLALIVPMIFSFRGKQETATVKGLLVAAALMFLLNATCGGLLITSSLGIGIGT